LPDDGRSSAAWRSPEEIISADVDILIPAALGGVLTTRVVRDLRCRAVVGPANNQLDTPEVAELLHQRGIIWVPDYVASAGGVINAITTELHNFGADQVLARVNAIEGTVANLLEAADDLGVTSAQAGLEMAQRRIRAAMPGTLSRPQRGVAPSARTEVADRPAPFI
jgi:glutamate dehydrogenase/leucine dehydrogenase